MPARLPAALARRRRAGAAGAAGAPRAHPFAAGPDAIRAALSQPAEPGTDLALKAAGGELILWLPGTATAPIASPELIRPVRPDGTAATAAAPAAGRPILHSWQVPVLALEPAAALGLLLALSGPPAPGAAGLAAPGGARYPDSGQPLALGGSVLYLAAVARLAADLAARGRVLPGLHAERGRVLPGLEAAPPGSAAADGTYTARWLPVLSGPDAQRARDLAAAVPAVCRATEAAGAPSAAVLTESLAALTDAAVRAALAARPGFGLLPPRSGSRRAARSPVTRRWASALTSGDPAVATPAPADQAAAAELAADLAAWHAAAQLPAGPVRACFRLVEPGAEPAEPAGTAWTVEFTLQSTDDPSLLLPAAEVWAGMTAGARAAAGIRHPDEQLLAGLGAAARLFPEIELALRGPAPTAVELDTAGALTFLRETGPLLAGAGFGVLLPDWARRTRLGLKLTARSRTAGDGGSVTSPKFGLADLVDFSCELAVGDQALDPAELAELARLKVPLIRLRGQWVELDHRHLQAALKWLERGSAAPMTAQDALATVLHGTDGDLPIVEVDADGWLGDLLSGQADQRLAPVETPASFTGTLRPYQERGLAWLSFLGDLGLGAILADDMGLGKCVLPSTPVFLNGALISAEDAWERFAAQERADGAGDWATPSRPLFVSALAMPGRRQVMVRAAVSRLYRQRVSEKVRRIRLDDGSEIAITRRHKLLGMHGWTRDFSIGDRVCVPARLEWNGQPVDPALTTLLARQIAEGDEDRHPLRVTQPAGQRAGPMVSGAASRDVPAVLGYARRRRPAAQRIPDLIVAADDDTVRRFLREYFSAEPSVRAGMRGVEISAASEWLMRQLACMLRRLGIWLRISQQQERAASGAGTGRPCWIGLIGGASLRRFHADVGFSDPVRQARLAALCQVTAGGGAEGSPGSDILALAAERLNSEVFCPRIVAIEETDYTGWVYDFEIADHHNFVAGGMLCHNTVQLLGLVAHEREIAAETGPTLLVCPMSLVGNWQREAQRFTPQLALHVHHGADRLAGGELASAMSGADLVVTTYGVAVRDQRALSQIQWARVVCDEAQNIKNSATRQSRAVRALPARTRIALTGTPVENRLGDLWSIMEFTRPGLLGPAERFRQHYAVPIERNGDEAAAERLRRITGPFILRRLKTDKAIISDLPDKAEMKVWCNLTPEQASLYQATVTDMLAKIEAAEPGIERRGLVLATMAKLKQACNHPAHLLGDGSRLAGRSGKLARLEEIGEEIVAAGDRALCFTQYAEFGRMLQPYLASKLGCEVLYLHGGTPKRQRDAMVARFQHETEPALFILSLKAGGTGLNLTAANHVIHIDRWWNPAVEDQATDRAFRIGQRKDVQVRKFACVGTVEERIDAMIEEKKALADKIVGTGESWLARLSVAELRDVITLAPEAVSQ